MYNLSLQTKIEYKSFFIYEFNSENIIQLKNGSILVFTSNQIFHLNKILNKSTLIDFHREYSTRSIKQLKNNKILFCNEKLYEIDIKKKEIKEISFSEKLDIKIYDIIKLKNGQIIVITDDNLINIELNDEEHKEVKINFIYKFPDEYILYRNLYDDKNYSNLYLLEGNKLLIHRYRAHNDNRSKCGNCRRASYYSNIIIVINLDIFEIIHQFEHFNNEINIVVLKKYICISYCRNIYIYNINSFKKIKDIDMGYYYSNLYIFKYDENTLISTVQSISNNTIVLFDLSDINDIQFSLLKNNYDFRNNEYIYHREFFKNKLIYKLKDQRILINIFPFIYIFELPKYFEFKSLKKE